MMRNGALALLVLILGATASRAEGWAEKMFKDGPEHNFGAVPYGAQLFHRFTVTNIFAVPLKINSVRCGGGCGSISASTDAIAPNKTGWVDVTMDASRFKGAKSITIFVEIGDDDHTSTAEVKISANARGDLIFNPGSISFGNVLAGETPKQTIDVEYAGDLEWKVTDIDTNKAPVEATFKEMYRKPKQVGYQITVQLKSDAQPGALKQELFVKTNDPASPLVRLVVEADVQASPSVTPRKLILSNVQVNEEILRRVVIRGIGSKPFTIKQVEGLGDGIELEEPLATKADTRHTLTFKCKFDKQGDIKRKLTIKTDLQEEPLTVAIEGNVIP